MIVFCEKHDSYNEFCTKCFCYYNGINQDSYYETIFEMLGDLLGCGPDAKMVFRATQEMISREQSMKKMISELRARNKTK